VSVGKVVVCQHGARHRYAVPRMLEEKGMLVALYTDSSAYSSLGRIASAFGCIAPASVKRLSKRIPHGVPHEKVYSSDLSVLIELGQRLMRRRPFGMALSHQRHQILSTEMKKWGLRGADIVYTMLQEGNVFVEYAKEKGVKIVVDVCVSPLATQIMDQEVAAFSDWGSETNCKDFLWLDSVKESLALADLLLCPSEFVAEGVRAVSPDCEHKIRILPYGCSIDYQGRTNVPVPGRVLFAGGDALRKGLHYLAQAASALKTKIPALDVRIAGDIPECVRQHSICKDLHFLGKLTTEQIKAEFLSADCFVLPSLAEGFAGVVAEAIGAGCPVIVTKEAGSPIEHDREGVIVPSRDAVALANAIERLVIDHSFRSACSRNCLQQFPFYSEEQWRKRLVDTLEQ